MALAYKNLDERTRELMLDEVNLDVSQGTLYLSKRLTEEGKQNYEALLKEAIQNNDDVGLGNELRGRGYMKSSEERRKPKGGFTIARVPVTAAETLAEGEFNRFYIRGLCLRAIADNIEALIIYRAKKVINPRFESEQMIGKEKDPKSLLEDLRQNPGVEPALGLPPGPNSGLSVHLP